MPYLNRRHKRRGAASVEFALVVPLLMVLLLGIVEFAMIGHHKLSLVQGCRAGAREASIGRSIALVKEKTRNAAPNVTLSEDQIIVEYTAQEDGSGGWTSMPDAGSGSANGVPYGYLVRVRVDGWPHPLVTGPFFSWLPGVSGNNLPLDAQMVMRRE
jgi:Flp pilus assembly protein TadG